MCVSERERENESESERLRKERQTDIKETYPVQTCQDSVRKRARRNSDLFRECTVCFQTLPWGFVGSTGDISQSCVTRGKLSSVWWVEWHMVDVRGVSKNKWVVHAWAGCKKRERREEEGRERHIPPGHLRGVNTKVALCIS